jgi:hypothetical protein
MSDNFNCLTQDCSHKPLWWFCFLRAHSFKIEDWHAQCLDAKHGRPWYPATQTDFMVGYVDHDSEDIVVAVWFSMRF